MLTVVQRSVAAGCRLNRRKKKPNTYQLLLEPALAGLAWCEWGHEATAATADDARLSHR